MASIDAINAIKSSTEIWSVFRSNHEGIIDLSLSTLKEINFSGKNISNCNFSGADLENANFDKCKIHNSFFNNCCLENASFVSCSISSSIFNDSNMDHVIFRDLEIRDSQFNKTKLYKVAFSNSKLHRCAFLGCANIFGANFEDIHSIDCQINEAEFFEVKINNSLFENCKFKKSIFRDCKLLDSVFETSSLRDLNFISSIISNIGFINCKVVNQDFSNSRIQQLNLSNSVISGANLIQYDLPNTIFYDSVIIKSVWPSQKGFTTILGEYNVNPNLLGHPVQDIKGLSPSLRREIADAQFLKEILSHSNRINCFLYRIWGITTNFGQSIFRLTFFSIIILLILTIIFIFDDINFLKMSESFNALQKTAVYITSSFIGFSSDNPKITYSSLQENCLIVSRLLGFFILGLWIGLAANKLGKLSSE